MGTTTFVWDPVFDCVTHELDENNNVTAEYHNEPQQFGGVLSQRRGTTCHYHHHDALGSTRFLTDSSGNVTDTYLHDAWGNLVASTGTTINPFKWIGKYGYYTDNSTAHVYVRARMYQSTVARWASRDPLQAFYVQENGFWYGKVSPAVRIDPSGLSPCLNKGLCRSEFCSTVGPHGFSEGINYFCGYLIDNGSCLTSRVRYFLRSNSSTFTAGRAFKECGDPAQKEIFSLFNRGQDFELLSYFDILGPSSSGVFEGCHLVKKHYALDTNRCYDLTFEWECDLKCGVDTEYGADNSCILPKADYVLGAWTRNPITGSISRREEIATYLLGFDTSLKTSTNSCACPIGGCEISVGLHWANNAMVWFEPGTTKPAGAAMTQNCSWNDLPQANGGQVGPGKPGNARLPKP